MTYDNIKSQKKALSRRQILIFGKAIGGGGGGVQIDPPAGLGLILI